MAVTGRACICASTSSRTQTCRTRNCESTCSPPLSPRTRRRSRSLTGAVDGVESAFGKVCEVRFLARAAGISIGHELRFQISLWQGGLPMDALPPQGWIEFSTAEPMEWMI